MQDHQAEQLPGVTNKTGAARSTGMILAFDFGLKRIGAAVGSLELGLAHPLSTINNESKHACFAGIDQLMEEWQPVLLVVGLPTYPDGTEHELTRRSRRFAHRLENRYGVETLLVDERYTSTSAGSALREAGVNGIKQKLVMDRVAAQLILQTYFDKRDAAT
jgi:putative Holliday junction resolvase